MKIAQISDIHIRNLKYHQDYRKVFENFYRKLDEIRPDLVVNTGDTAHTKTNISPEFVEMASDLFVQIAKRCPLVNVLGNHDLNLMNEDRQDAITPIVEALNNRRIVLLKDSGPFRLPAVEWGLRYSGPDIVLWNYGIADAEHWPIDANTSRDDINIGMFHGSIRNCLTDSNFRMTHVEYDTDIFQKMDFVMMGDIHKRQSFNDGRVWYAGSMIQQNFGEEPEKGFLLWAIEDRNNFRVDFHELKGSRRFYTIKLGDDLVIPQTTIEPDSRIRISPPRPLTLVEQKAVEKIVRKRYSPHDVITLGVKSIGQHSVDISTDKVKIENLRTPEVQERLIREYLAPRNLPEHIVQKIVDINRKYQIAIDQRDDIARNVHWRILKMGWSNLYNYGENNIIDFAQIKGLTGIFAPNASGKSGMIDAITIGAFDANTKEVSRNVSLINDNKDRAVVIMEMLSNHDRYSIERVIERIKFGTRKGQEKEWGKTTLDFYRYDDDGAIEKLVMESRPDTEKQIRRRFGTFDDFMLTSLFAQWDPMDIIMVKETERKRILYRFLDLDIFEEKAKLAKDEAKEWVDRLAELEEGGYEGAVKQLEERIAKTKAEIEKEENGIEIWLNSLRGVEESIEKLLEAKVPVAVPTDVEGERRKLTSVAGEIKRQQTDLVGKRERYEEVARRLQATEEQWADFDVDYVKEQVDRLNEVKEELFSLKALLKDHERHVADRKRQAELLGKVPCGDQFPSCQFLVNAFQAKRELPEHEEEVKDFKEKIEGLQIEHDDLEQHLAKLNEYDDAQELIEKFRSHLKMASMDIRNRELEIEKLEGETRRLREVIAHCEQVEADIRKNKEIEDELKVQRMAKAELEDILKKRRTLVTSLNRQLGADQAVLEKVSKELEQLKEVRDTCTAFEHFTMAMGKDGIALQILTQKLPLINEEINKILGSACEFGVYIEYDPDEQSIRLYIQYGQYKSRLLELGSGAEKFLASLAIRAALLSISNLPRSNMFIIDEGFGKLDPSNLESVQRMFDYLKSVFDHVIVISHTDLMKDMVDNIIDIVPDEEGYAHVEVGG